MMQQSTETEQIERIHSWMVEVVEHRSYGRYDDLHLDKIDPAYVDPLTWLAGGTRCLDAAITLRDSNKWPFAVALGVSLKAGPKRIGRNFKNFEQVSGELAWSPPSLYIFPREDTSWLGGPELEELGPEYHAPTKSPSRSYFREWHDTNDEEYRRTLWLVG